MIYSLNLNISPKMSCGVLECGVYCSVTESHAYAFVVKDFVIERGRYLCRTLYLLHDGHRIPLSRAEQRSKCYTARWGVSGTVRACLLMGAVLFAVTIHFCCLTKVLLSRQGFPSKFIEKGV
ncbi:hypothetical protein HJG60_009923 [Phyllostomus discolor]|uniref:Uncharacterized protein n=1 Tax=Phyllostomus discolor TaxID=89673 RepID=A0A834B9X7_9CHIR|nr:hypothetical protein HJG60_009923 [Phyllostomus discolor]